MFLLRTESKMKVKLLPILVFALVKVVNLEETNNHAFDIVSTSQRPSQDQLVDKRLTKLEERLEFHTRLIETNHRLEALELQNKKIQETLENLNFALTNCTRDRTEMSEISHQLKKIVLQNQQIQMGLQNIDTGLNTIPNKFQSTRSNKTFPKNCKEIKDSGVNISNIYRVKPKGSDQAFSVFCDMEIKGGGWTYVVNRFDGSQNFYLGWKDYKNGFGNISGEFWLGLEHLYQLTDDEDNELLVELVNRRNLKVYAHYKQFSIGNEMKNYFLKTIEGYSGDAENSFTQHVGAKFSTKDRDNDAHVGNCAEIFKGGWWYYECFKCQFTGLFKSVNETGIFWNNWPFQQAKMMVKPRSTNSPTVY